MNVSTLIDASMLAAHVNDDTWRIFDCRHELSRPEAGAQAYAVAHIPNAQFLHLDHDLSGPTTGHNGRHPLPDPSRLAKTLARAGVSNATQVVAYDDAGGAYAARLWWLLRWLGHDKVAVLDGGLPAWVRAGHALTNAVPQVSPAEFTWAVWQSTVSAADVFARLKQPTQLLMDARGADRFRGENETIDPVAGHIPGAVSRPFRDNLDAEGRFKPAAQLRREFEQILGSHPIDTAVSYCGSGVTACQNLLALELAGLRGARLYPGSWSEWCSDPQRPVERGDG